MVCLFIWENRRERKGGGKGIVGVRPDSRSHLRLQVHDLLAHQRNGGTGLLPVYCLQLQRRGRHCLQVLPHPRWGGVGLPDALPCPLTRGLQFVLFGRGQRGKKACLSEIVIKSEVFWWTYFTSLCLFIS